MMQFAQRVVVLCALNGLISMGIPFLAGYIYSVYESGFTSWAVPIEGFATWLALSGGAAIFTAPFAIGLLLFLDKGLKNWQPKYKYVVVSTLAWLIFGIVQTLPKNTFFPWYSYIPWCLSVGPIVGILFAANSRKRGWP